MLNKKIISFLVAVLLFTGNLAASESRTQSMGQTGIFLKDNSNVTLFPGSTMLYRNLVIAELREYYDENSFSAGIHLPMGNQAIVGLYLNRPLNLPVPVNASNLIFLRHATDLIFSFPVGDKALGFRFTGAYADADAESSPIDSLALSEQARYFELAGGVSSPFYDFSAFFGLPQVLSETRNDTYDWSGIGFGVAGRFFLGPEDGLQYVPAVILNNFTSIYDVNGVESDRTYLEFRMLGGVRYQINAENLVVAGLEVFGIRQDEGDTPDVISERTRITNMPAFYIGAETHALRWLFLRVGAVQRYQETESSYKLPNTSRVTDRRWASDFDFYFGAGVRFGAFQLDLDINDQFLFDGPDFISGSGSSGRFANRVSVSYEF